MKPRTLERETQSNNGTDRHAVPTSEAMEQGQALTASPAPITRQKVRGGDAGDLGPRISKAAKRYKPKTVGKG